VRESLSTQALVAHVNSCVLAFTYLCGFLCCTQSGYRIGMRTPVACEYVLAVRRLSLLMLTFPCH
jgi:hypothetical protein